MTTTDAVIVGARCAGATLATLLSRAGWQVLLIDSARFPSDTVSTHIVFPDTVHLLEQMGVLARLRATHVVPRLGYRWRVLGREIAGGFSPVGGVDRATCVRRVVLDQAMLDTATEAGAAVRLDCRVADLVGTGTADDPVRGVVLDTGELVTSRWVFGADGRISTVARRLGLATTRQARGEQSFLFGYWRGLPTSEWICFDVHDSRALMSTPCEDDIHLLCLVGEPSLSRGSATDRTARYHEALRRFPATLNPRLLDHAERVSPVVAVPETMMRGFYRRPAGPGWALIGDAGHFKHPATAQGIGDAVGQAHHVAEAVTVRGDLTGYETWRDERARGHFEWSYSMGTFPTGDGARSVFAGLAGDPVAAMQWRDLLTKRQRPSDVYTPARLMRWRAAWAYEDGRRRVTALVVDLPDDQLGRPVAACPAWTVRALIAHMVGLAADSTVGAGYFAGAVDAWRQPQQARARDEWTARQVAARRDRGVDVLLREWDERGHQLETMLRDGSGFAAEAPEWMLGSPAADLGVHLHDLREALGLPGDEAAAVTKFAYHVFRQWFAQRLSVLGRPALLLDDGVKPWVAGDGEAKATLRADRFELFRVLSGRRSAQRIVGLSWDGDPVPYLDVISPYPPIDR
jgi:uncharacterized protein (TIGR03083 family)